MKFGDRNSKKCIKSTALLQEIPFCWQINDNAGNESNEKTWRGKQKQDWNQLQVI